jgi:hypothetical protein
MNDKVRYKGNTRGKKSSMPRRECITVPRASLPSGGASTSLWKVLATTSARANRAVCLCVAQYSTIYHLAASSSPGTSRLKYIVHGGCPIASVPHVPNTPTVELLGQSYQSLATRKGGPRDLCCAEQRCLWLNTRTQKSRMRMTKETSRRSALMAL